MAPRPAVDAAVLSWNGGGFRTLVIRPGCVYGGSGSLTASWFESAGKGGAARVVGDGTNRWAMVHRDDLADLYVRAAESGLGGEVLNATDRSRATVNECAAAASLAAGAEGRVEHVPVEQAVAAMGPFATCLALNQHVDSWKAVHRLGWTPRHGGFVDAAPRLYAAWKAARAGRRDGAAPGSVGWPRPDGRGRAPASRVPLGRRRLAGAGRPEGGCAARTRLADGARDPTATGPEPRHRTALQTCPEIPRGRTIRRTVPT